MPTILLILCIFSVGYMLGQRKGWSDGIRIAREWESMYRDVLMYLETERATTPEEILSAKEVRDLKRMYDGI